MEKSRSRPFLAALAALALATGAGDELWPQPRASLPPEAPSSLFSVELGGTEAELLVKGSWEAKLLAQAALEADSSGLRFSSIQPLLFSQSPDLYLSFLLFRKYFVDARVSDDISQARYSFGYRGGEDESLAEVRAGNDGISFPAMPFLSFGEGSYRSFGVAASTRAEGFSGRAMLRYDQAQRVSKRYSGGSELSDTVLAPHSFVRGRWLYAPGATALNPATNLDLYAESVSGAYSGSDSRKYRRLEPGEYSTSAATGLVSLARASETRVAARYDGMAPATITIGGVGCLLLYDPEDFADPLYQVLSRYATTADPAVSEAFVRDASSGLKDPGYEARIDASGYVEVMRSDYARTADDPLDGSYARPFFDPLDGKGLNWIYTTDLSEEGNLDYGPVSMREIVVRSRSAADAMSIDADYIPGSVELRRDGAPEYGFSVDPDLHSVELASPAGPYEVIDISYLRESSERRTGSLAGGLAGLWNLGEGRSAWAALGLRWALPGVGYGAADAANPGSLVLTAGERDAEGGFTHRAALAASYGRTETSNRYRIEGMESSGAFVTSFRPVGTTSLGFSAAETLDYLLAAEFPRLISTLHRDGSAQQALRLSDSDAWADTELVKVLPEPPYADFGEFSFFVMTSAQAGTVTLGLDEGAGSGGAAVELSIPLGSFPLVKWRRIVVKYGDLDIYYQDGEGDELTAFGPAIQLAAPFDPGSRASRLRIAVAGAGDGQTIWIDEICLEESVGSQSLLIQGELAYARPDLLLGPRAFPLVQGFDAKADLSAALHRDSYASGGASLGTRIGPLGVKLRARALASADGGAAAKGGHELILPAAAFPVRISDRFDYDPATGAFGRGDLLSLSAGALAGLELSQSSSWTPASSLVEGILEQEWKGRLGFAGNRVSLDARAANRARPAAGPGLEDRGYGAAWIRSFSSFLPAFEPDSDLRSETLALKAALGPGADFLSASATVSVEPGASLVEGSSAEGEGLRRNTASIRAALPLAFGGIEFKPYYERSWSEARRGAAGGTIGDLELALGDFAGFAPLYSPSVFAELLDKELPSAFGAASSAADLVQAAFAPELGLALSREYGSFWWDLLAPSELSLAFRRELARDGDSLTDSGQWRLSAKAAAVNVFGSLGSRPSLLGFDSDEYLASVQAVLKRVSGEAAPRLSLQAQHLASFLSGSYDRLNAENRLLVSVQPAKTEWSENLSIELSRRVARHWLLDLYGLALPRLEGEGEDGIVSRYLEDIASREPNARTTFGLAASVKRAVTDLESPDPSWSASEYYEAKLTVPERLTVTAKAALGQGRDGVSGLLSFGGSLSLGLVLSF